MGNAFLCSLRDGRGLMLLKHIFGVQCGGAEEQNILERPAEECLCEGGQTGSMSGGAVRRVRSFTRRTAMPLLATKKIRVENHRAL